MRRTVRIKLAPNLPETTMTPENPIRRRPTNLSLEEDLVAEARRLGISLSRAAEAGIRQMNAYVAEHELPLAKYRLF